MVELGCYMGYSAIRFANVISNYAHYYSFELNPDFAKIAQACIDHAGLSGKITIIVGSFAERFKELKSTFGIRTVDVIYSSHTVI